jgi:hypothetical protein
MNERLDECVLVEIVHKHYPICAVVRAVTGVTCHIKSHNLVAHVSMQMFSGRLKARGLITERTASETNGVEGDDIIAYVIVQTRG